MFRCKKRNVCLPVRCSFHATTRTVSRPNSQPGGNKGHKMIPCSCFGAQIRMHVCAIRHVLDDKSSLDQPIHEGTQGVPVLSGSWNWISQRHTLIDPGRICISDLSSLQVGMLQHISFPVPVVLCHTATEGIGTVQVVD